MHPNLRAFLLVFGSAALAHGVYLALPSQFDYFTTIFILACINAILAVSLNLVNGITGQFSLGHAGFMAVGAYVSAVTSTALGLSFPASLMLGGLAAALAGYLVGLPSLRLRGDYLAIVTLGFGEIIRVFILNMDFLGGARGFIGIPVQQGPFWVVLVLAFCVVACVRLMESTHGRAWLCIREDEVAAEAAGIDSTRYKVLAFTLSAFAAGLAGALFAHAKAFINPASFSFLKSVDVVVMVVLGGMGSMTGSLLAAFVLTLLLEALRPVAQVGGVDLRMVFYSMALIGMMLWRPQGMLGRSEIWEIFRRKGRAGHRPAPTNHD